MNGKGDSPRACSKKKYDEGYANIDWSKKKDTICYKKKEKETIEILSNMNQTEANEYNKFKDSILKNV